MTPELEQELNEEEIESFDELWQMCSIYEENWSEFSEEERDFLLEKFLEKLKSGGEESRVYKYKGKDKILSFLNISDSEEGKKSFTAFNSSTSMRGAKLGDGLLRQVFEDEGKDCLIEGYCVQKDNPKDISFAYVEKYGFVITDIDSKMGGFSWSPFKIEREKSNERYYYRDKDYSEDEIVKIYETEFSGQRSEEKKPKFIMRFDNLEDMKKESEKILKGEEIVVKNESNATLVIKQRKLEIKVKKLLSLKKKLLKLKVKLKKLKRI